MNNPQPEPDARKLRIGIVGYGFIAAYGHIPGYLERIKRNGDLQIVAIADIVPARREAAAGLLAGVRIYNSAEALLENEADNLDYVDICTPPYDHARIAALALRKGLHVLCEKPLTIHYWEAEKPKSAIVNTQFLEPNSLDVLGSFQVGNAPLRWREYCIKPI